MMQKFNPNIIYNLYINDYLYIEVLYNGNELKIVSKGNCPKDTVYKVNTKNNKVIIMAGRIPKCTVDLATGKVFSSEKITPTAHVRNFSELYNGLVKKENVDDYVRNQMAFEKGIEEPVINGTELHTHFMEVLSGEQFLDIILSRINYLEDIDGIGVDSRGILCDAYPLQKNNPKCLDTSQVRRWYSREELLSNRNMYNNLVSQLSIPTGKQVSFGEINRVLKRRTALLDLVGYYLYEHQINALEISSDTTEPLKDLERRVKQKCSDGKAIVYTDLLKESLETLKNQGIKYVEFSYSNSSTIRKIYHLYNDLDPTEKVEGIKFNFLLSENRNASAPAFRRNSLILDTENNEFISVKNKQSVECELKKLIDQGYVTGFDLMGLEQEITPNDYVKDSMNNSSLYDKLEPILCVLNSYHRDDLVCRLHAGEMIYPESIINDGKSNPERTLEIVDKIANNNKINIPPPRIRLGHGIHFVGNNHYLDLLKKYKVTIEINASSNFALGNIKNLKDIPYNWYLNNGIPVVLGTDGGGFYLTTPIDESNLAQMFGSNELAKMIHEHDERELERRNIYG